MDCLEQPREVEPTDQSELITPTIGRVAAQFSSNVSRQADQSRSKNLIVKCGISLGSSVAVLRPGVSGVRSWDQPAPHDGQESK
jgi:hypothetical protein